MYVSQSQIVISASQFLLRHLVYSTYHILLMPRTITVRNGQMRHHHHRQIIRIHLRHPVKQRTEEHPSAFLLRSILVYHRIILVEDMRNSHYITFRIPISIAYGYDMPVQVNHSVPAFHLAYHRHSRHLPQLTPQFQHSLAVVVTRCNYNCHIRTSGMNIQ